MELLDLQKRIAARMADGGGMAEVKREIIDCAELNETQRAALWLYAASQPNVRRSAKPLHARPAATPLAPQKSRAH